MSDRKSEGKLTPLCPFLINFIYFIGDNFSGNQKSLGVLHTNRLRYASGPNDTIGLIIKLRGQKITARNEDLTLLLLLSIPVW